MLKRFLFFVLLVVLSGCGSYEPETFEGLTPQQVVSELKKIKPGKRYQEISVHPEFAKNGKEQIVVNYVEINTFDSIGDCMRLSKVLAQTKGSERFGEIVWRAWVETTDGMGNDGESYAYTMTFDFDTLRKVNWKSNKFTEFEMANLAEISNVKRFGKQRLAEYCMDSGGNDYSKKFCMQVLMVLNGINTDIHQKPVAPAKHEQAYDTSHAVKYGLMNGEKHLNEKRPWIIGYAYLIGDADGLTQRKIAETAMKAAISTQTGWHATFVRLDLLQTSSNKNSVLAIAKYATDGKGLNGEGDWTWEIHAADRGFTPEELRAVKLPNLKLKEYTPQRR